MGKEEILEKLKGVFVEQLGVDKDKITEDSTFISLGADSLDTVELVMSIEEEFDIDIPDSQAEKLTNVKAAVDYISESITA